MDMIFVTLFKNRPRGYPSTDQKVGSSSLPGRACLSGSPENFANNSGGGFGRNETTTSRCCDPAQPLNAFSGQPGAPRAL
jgi:hypothetical protein